MQNLLHQIEKIEEKLNKAFLIDAQTDSDIEAKAKIIRDCQLQLELVRMQKQADGLRKEIQITTTLNQ